MKTPPTHHVISLDGPQEPLVTVRLVLGILGVLGLGPLTGVPAIICSHIARSKAREVVGQRVHGGRALAGTVMGYCCDKRWCDELDQARAFPIP